MLDTTRVFLLALLELHPVLEETIILTSFVALCAIAITLYSIGLLYCT